MKVYVIKRRDFSHSSAECESWELPLEAVSTESGKAVLTKYATQECVGDWLYIKNKLVRISKASPKDDKLTISTADPITAFDRKCFFPDEPETYYGDFIKSALERDYKNCTDEFFRLPYLQITSTDTTRLVKPDLDDTKLYTLKNIMAAARRRGVVIEFGLATTNAAADTLTVNIYTAPGTTHKIFFNDGHHQLESETYSPNELSRVTVMQEDESEDETAAKTYTLYDFYLSADGVVSDTVPANRAEGIWEYTTCQSDDTPLRVAAALFQNNLQSHKIEFYSDKQYGLYDNVILRLPERILKTQIIYVGAKSKDERYHYKCGQLAVTLTDKVNATTGG